MGAKESGAENDTGAEGGCKAPRRHVWSLLSARLDESESHSSVQRLRSDLALDARVAAAAAAWLGNRRGGRRRLRPAQARLDVLFRVVDRGKGREAEQPEHAVQQAEWQTRQPARRHLR